MNYVLHHKSNKTKILSFALKLQYFALIGALIGVLYTVISIVSYDSETVLYDSNLRAPVVRPLVSDHLGFAFWVCAYGKFSCMQYYRQPLMLTNFNSLFY